MGMRVKGVHALRTIVNDPESAAEKAGITHSKSLLLAMDDAEHYNYIL